MITFFLGCFRYHRCSRKNWVFYALPKVSSPFSRRRNSICSGFNECGWKCWVPVEYSASLRRDCTLLFSGPSRLGSCRCSGVAPRHFSLQFSVSPLRLLKQCQVWRVLFTLNSMVPSIFGCNLTICIYLAAWRFENYKNFEFCIIVEVIFQAEFAGIFGFWITAKSSEFRSRIWII